MKKHILTQYTDLLQEQQDLQKKIRKIQKKLDIINREGNVEDTVKGGIGGLQNFHIEGFPVADYEEAEYLLKKYRRILKEREIKIAESLIKVEKYLNNLDDSRMRRMITYKYIEGKTWYQVAELMGKAYTEDSCKKQMERFLKNL